ncbi:MAG TPA: hypothetical protein VIG30_12095 [Ktedonobacterales bacterium]
MLRHHPQLRGIGAVVIAVVVLFGCGLGGGTSTIVQGGGTNTPAAATNTPPPTPTPKPTATPTPGHLLVTVHPNPPGYYGITGTTGDATCHTGSTCSIDGPCTSPDWPTFILSNSGQAALTWHVTITVYAGAWNLSATSGTIGGGGATNVTVTQGNEGGGAQYVFTGPGQTVTINIGCGAG